MAEALKPSAIPATSPPVPVEAQTAQPVEASEPSVVRLPNKILVYLSQLLTTTFWVSLGLGLLVLSIILRRFQHFVIPAFIQPLVAQIFRDLPYFVAGIGLCCVGTARDYVRVEYQDELRKNRLFLHGWKVPLIATQVYIFWLSGVYAIGAGIRGLWPKLSDPMGLTLFFLLFFGYLLWYATAHFKNRFPGIAGLRIALISLIFAILSYFAWVGTHYVFDSLLLAFFAIVAGITSVVIAPFHLDEHKATWLRALFLAGSVVALLPVGIHTLSTENKMDLVDLGPAMQGITGSVETLTYSDDGRRMAFSQKNNAGWFLQVVCPESGQYPVFKIPAGESSFRPIFVEKGFSVVMDGVLNGVRNLWQVNSLDGTIWLLTKGGIEPFGDGRPWNEKTHQLLIVTKEKDKYYLKAYNLPKRKMETLLNSSGTFLTPSWTAAGDNISYVDGITHQPYIYNIEDKESALLTSNLETEDEAEPGKKPQRFEVTEVFSAPDDFRYLFVAQKDGVKSVWTVMPDGSKRYKLYETPEQKNLSPASLFHSLKGLFNRGKTQPLYVQADQFSWTPDAQQIIFQEKSRKLGFWGETYSIRILNANTGDVGNADSANLIASQISHNAPAISPDGVKIAFAAQQGLWVTVPPPSFIFPIYTSLWVAVLR